MAKGIGEGEVMRKELIAYRKGIDELIEACPAETDWDSVIAAHLVKTSFFQHERLVHLLVTLAFALMELLSALAALVTGQPLAAVLALLLLVLLAPYIVHYYFLENETQKLYAQYDQMMRNMTGK